jgi:hypothetical protein
MIDKASALPALMTRAARLAVGQGLELRTYKRDRCVAIMRTGEDEYTVQEDGFTRQTWDTDSAGLRRVLRTLLRKEFPRSKKIRLAATQTTSRDGKSEASVAAGANPRRPPRP